MFSNQRPALKLIQKPLKTKRVLKSYERESRITGTMLTGAARNSKRSGLDLGQGGTDSRFSFYAVRDGYR